MHRTNIEIRRKTNEILGRSLGPLSKATGTSGYDDGSDSPAKAALSIVKVNRDTIAARSHSGILTGKRFCAETLPANMVGDVREQQQRQKLTYRHDVLCGTGRHLKINGVGSEIWQVDPGLQADLERTFAPRLEM